MKDLSDEAPIRRMCVARGTIRHAPEQLDLTRLEHAAQLAVKAAPSIVADLHTTNVTHVQVDVRDVDDDVELTVTVQAFHRGPLAPYALAGVAGAFLTLDGATLHNVHVVQEL